MKGHGKRGLRYINESTLYAVLMVQKGEGCDYTIGCGFALYGLAAREPIAAREEAESLFRPGGALASSLVPGHEKTPTRAVVVRIGAELDLEGMARRMAEADAWRQETRERAQLAARLKKYGP